VFDELVEALVSKDIEKLRVLYAQYDERCRMGIEHAYSPYRGRPLKFLIELCRGRLSYSMTKSLTSYASHKTLREVVRTALEKLEHE